jgi:SAM-dependent methyltransferase
MIENRYLKKNLHEPTVKGFGAEWTSYDQSELSEDEKFKIFNDYFVLFPWHLLSREKSIGLDAGCGSGRWASLVAPKVHKLYVLDASKDALKVSERNLRSYTNIEYICRPIEEDMLPEKSLDFAYSLGVLHHIPDTFSGIKAIAKTLKQDAPFLLYLYYNFENKPWYYKFVWKCSEKIRYLLSRSPFAIRKLFCEMIALCIYWPLARIACLLEQVHRLPNGWPLAYYSQSSFYTMRTDALDRFGTCLEQRFSKVDIQSMLEKAGFDRITFSDKSPFWCVIAFKK